MVGWLTYCLLIPVLLSVAALAADRSARAVGRPTRWWWAVSLMGGVALPLWSWLSPGVWDSAGPAGLPAPGAYVMDLVAMPVVEPGGADAGAAVDWPSLLLAAWATASAALLLFVAFSLSRLHRRSRRWRPVEVDGLEVLVTRSTGPAAVGVLRGRVLVPEWALGLEPSRRRLLLLHEAEHVRARDPQLALAGLALCALMPWNPVLWWQLARLRLAIEMDCDARVLRQSRDIRGYGSLLLEVGQRRARLAVALAESRTSLERRIRMMTRTERGWRVARAAGLAVVAVVVVAVACETPGPTSLSAPDRDGLTAEDVLAGADELDCEPRWYIDGEVADRGRLVTGELVEADRVESVEVIKGAVTYIGGEQGAGGHCGVILVTTKDASPEALERQRRVIEELRARQATRDTDAASLDELAEGPTFTPMTVRPQLRNAAEVQRALMQHYPPMLREAGVDGTVNMWFLIGPDGSVVQTRINTSSGEAALDDAALRVADVMAFTPAYNRDRPVPVWVALDIRFSTSTGEDAGARDRAQGDAEGAAAARRRAVGERQRSAAQPRGQQPAAQEPTFTPMTERPQLRNVDEVRDAIRSHYPPLLRNAGIEGTANVWLFIDETGVVRQTRINRTSGYDALDAAALEVARGMAFTPARNRDAAVPVWVALDVRFGQE